MPIDASKVQWDAAPAASAIDINAVQWDAPAAPSEVSTARKPSGFESAINKVLSVPAGVPAAAYGLLEVPTTLLTGAVGNLVGTPIGIASTFGEKFGTPEAAQLAQERAAKIAGAMTYQPQTTVGRTIIGGLSKAAEGMPPMLGGGTGSQLSILAAPAMAQAGPAAVRAVSATKQALGPSATKLARMTSEDYARGPQIDALKEAQRLKIVVPPRELQDTAGVRLQSALGGEKSQQIATKNNILQVRKTALNELELPETARLDSPETFDAVRAKLAKPYNEVKSLPIQTADAEMTKRLEALRADLNVIGAKEYAPAIDKIVEDAISKTQSGLTGDELLKNIQVLRERARKTYNNKAATTEALDIADTNLKVATELESLIENSITNPKLLDQFRNARRKMAQSYAYEGATDMNTGMLDVNKIARITSKNNALTGDIAALGKIAGNFPDSFVTKPISMWGKAMSLGRTGAAGGLGGLAGWEAGGYPGAIIGSIVGSLGGAAGQNFLANRLASPGYQAGLRIRDLRMPVNQLAAPLAPPIPQGQAIVPYQAPVEVLPPGAGPYQPNWVYGRPEAQVTPGLPPQTNLLAAPSPTSTMSALRAEDVRRAGMSRTLGQAAEQRGEVVYYRTKSGETTTTPPNEPADMYTRVFRGTGGPEGRDIFELRPMGPYTPPKRGEGVSLRLDERGNLVPDTTVQGTELPQISSLESAAKKLSGQMVAEKVKGLTQMSTRQAQAFAMTAEEKIAWNKAKADLAEVAPGFKALTDKAVAEKMLDRAWVEQTAVKAREKAAAFEQLAARAADARARQTAIANRERMLDLAEQMESTLGPRPVRSGIQGPKTRAARQNMLAPERNIENGLVR